MEVACAYLLIEKPFILLNHEGIYHEMPHFSVYAQDGDGVGSNFGIMSNPGVAGVDFCGGVSLVVVLAVIKGY